MTDRVVATDEGAAPAADPHPVVPPTGNNTTASAAQGGVFACVKRLFRCGAAGVHPPSGDDGVSTVPAGGNAVAQHEPADPVERSALQARNDELRRKDEELARAKQMLAVSEKSLQELQAADAARGGQAALITHQEKELSNLLHLQEDMFQHLEAKEAELKKAKTQADAVTRRYLAKQAELSEKDEALASKDEEIEKLRRELRALEAIKPRSPTHAKEHNQSKRKRRASLSTLLGEAEHAVEAVVHGAEAGVAGEIKHALHLDHGGCGSGSGSGGGGVTGGGGIAAAAAASGVPVAPHVTAMPQAAKDQALLLFDAHDEDDNGMLDEGELRHLLHDVGFLPEEIDRVWDESFKSFDTGAEGALDFAEFVRLYETIKAKVIQQFVEKIVAKVSHHGDNAAEHVKLEYEKACKELDTRLDNQRAVMAKKLKERLRKRAAEVGKLAAAAKAVAGGGRGKEKERLQQEEDGSHGDG